LVVGPELALDDAGLAVVAHQRQLEVDRLAGVNVAHRGAELGGPGQGRVARLPLAVAAGLVPVAARAETGPLHRFDLAGMPLLVEAALGPWPAVVAAGAGGHRHLAVAPEAVDAALGPAAAEPGASAGGVALAVARLGRAPLVVPAP